MANKATWRRPWLAPSLLGLGFVLLGLFAGLLEAAVAPGPFRLRNAAGLSLAGVLWVPLTFAITALARRMPWDPRRQALFWALHIPASLATSFALNAEFFGVLWLAGALPGTELVPAVVRASLRWLHLNAGAYWAILVAVYVLDRRGRHLTISSEISGSDPASDPALVVPSGQGSIRLPWSEISRIEAEGDYVRAHTEERSYLLSLRMKELESQLEGSPLIRVHRSVFVNADHVREVRHRSHGDYRATLADGTVVRVSRTRRAPLLRRVRSAEPD